MNIILINWFETHTHTNTYVHAIKFLQILYTTYHKLNGGANGFIFLLTKVFNYYHVWLIKKKFNIYLFLVYFTFQHLGLNNHKLKLSIVFPLTTHCNVKMIGIFFHVGSCVCIDWNLWLVMNNNNFITIQRDIYLLLTTTFWVLKTFLHTLYLQSRNRPH